MKRRSLILGLGVAAGGGAVGTGAFTSIEADRDVAVEVADDSDAFLQLQGATDNDGDELPNAQYARERNGILELDFTGDNDDIADGGEGFNARADTGISQVFEVRNQGTQEVEVALRTSEEDDTETNGTVIAPDINTPGDQNILLAITAHDPPGDEPLDPVPLGVGDKQQFSVTAVVRSDPTIEDPEDLPDPIVTSEITIQAEVAEQ